MLINFVIFDDVSFNQPVEFSMKKPNILITSAGLLLSVILMSSAVVFAQDRPYDNLVGTWDGYGDYQGQPFDFTFLFTADNDTLKGTWSSFDLGSFPLEGMKYEKIEDSENNKLTGTINLDFVGQICSKYLSSTVEKDKISGSLGSEMGDTPISATKRKPK